MRKIECLIQSQIIKRMYLYLYHPCPPPGQPTSNTQEFGTFSSPKGGTRKRRSHKKKTRRFRR